MNIMEVMIKDEMFKHMQPDFSYTEHQRKVRLKLKTLCSDGWQPKLLGYLPKLLGIPLFRVHAREKYESLHVLNMIQSQN